MSGRWYVIKNDEQQGPYSASEIREGLRLGAFDPFDLVAREGSSIRQELLEVDEIFVNKQVHFTEGSVGSLSGPSKPKAPAPKAPVSGDTPPRQAAPPLPTVAAGDTGGGDHTVVSNLAALRQTHQLESPQAPVKASAEIQPAPRSNIKFGKAGKADAKRFFLIDKKKRIVGPLNASEILQKYSKGLLDPSVRVQKMNGTAQVPIDKFVQVYAAARAGGPTVSLGPQPANQLVIPGGLPSSRVMAELVRAAAVSKAQSHRLVLPLVSLACLLMALVIGYFAVTLLWRGDKTLPWSGKKPVAAKILPKAVPRGRPLPDAPSKTMQAAKEAPLPAELRDASDDFEIEEPASASLDTPPKPAKALKPASKPVKAPHAAAVKPKPKPAAKIVTRVQPATRRLPTPRRYVPPTKSFVPVVQKPVAPKPYVAPRPLPQANPAPVLKVGEVVTLNSARFNRAALESCAMKCRLAFATASGPVTAIFFKGSFEPILKAATGAVQIRGKIGTDGAGKVLYLQDVK